MGVLHTPRRRSSRLAGVRLAYSKDLNSPGGIVVPAAAAATNTTTTTSSSSSSSPHQTSPWRTRSSASSSDSAEFKKFRRVLKSYKYVSPNLSFFEELFLDDFWNAVASHYPRWIAPNAITSIGACFIILCCAVQFSLCPQLDSTAPSWCYFALYPACIFIYNTMDGSDGKHARNTKSGSPLGEVSPSVRPPVLQSVHVSLFLSSLLKKFCSYICT